MKIHKEISLKDFEFWGGAASRVDYLTECELDALEYILDELYPEGITDSKLNDKFWFEFDWIAGLLGTTEEEVLARDI